MRAKLVEKKEPAKPDYFGAAYFGLVALFCIYELAAGATYLSPYVVAPIFYMLITLAVFAFPMMLYLHFAGLATSMFWDVKKGRQRIDSAFSIFIGLVLITSIAWGYYNKIEPQSRSELVGPVALGMFAISIAQLVIVSYPFGLKGSRPGLRLVNWSSNIYKFGLGPAMTSFATLFLSALLYGLAIGNRDMEGRLISILFYFIVLLFVIYKIKKWLLEKGKINEKGAYGEYMDGKTKDLFYPLNGYDAIGALAVAVFVQVPLYYFSGNISQIQIDLIIFSFTYAALAFIEFNGYRLVKEKDGTAEVFSVWKGN
ncbi:hypothetical protein FJZ26_01855 [Candidatus Parvarchaeota archaeon]|nr:hypothetical protein [Candidatus Parvarchaeota archaeon]